MECDQTSPSNTRDAHGRESNSPVLRSLIDCMPTVVFSFVLTIVSPCITIESDRVVIKNASRHFIHMDVFAFSMVGAFASALSSFTFRPSLPAIAHVLEDLPVVFLGSAFASLVSVLIHDEHFRWFAYIICMIPAIPLFRRRSQSLSNCLVASVRILAAIVARWFDGGEASVQMGDGCGAV